MEWGIFIGSMILILAIFRPLRARIAASDSDGAQRFRRWHKPMERIGAAALVISALGVFFLPEGSVPAVIPVLGAIVFYCSMLTRPDRRTSARPSASGG
jgi:hypothetical protein